MPDMTHQLIKAVENWFTGFARGKFDYIADYRVRGSTMWIKAWDGREFIISAAEMTEEE